MKLHEPVTNSVKEPSLPIEVGNSPEKLVSAGTNCLRGFLKLRKITSQVRIETNTEKL